MTPVQEVLLPIFGSTDQAFVLSTLDKLIGQKIRIMRPFKRAGQEEIAERHINTVTLLSYAIFWTVNGVNELQLFTHFTASLAPDRHMTNFFAFNPANGMHHCASIDGDTEQVEMFLAD